MKQEDQYIMYGVYIAIALLVLANTWFVITGALSFIGAVAVYEWYRTNQRK
jgi:hypothetical protein